MNDPELKLRPGRLHTRTLEGETIAVDTVSSDYLTFNHTATELWSLLVEGTTRTALVDRLVSRFSADPEQAERDVADFIESLRRQDLLET